VSSVTTIQLGRDVLESLKTAREYPRQTYNDLIQRMLETFASTKKQNQYDEFLHKIQQPKMKELWGGKEDDFWDKV